VDDFEFMNEVGDGMASVVYLTRLKLADEICPHAPAECVLKVTS
jgi:hypothetical protein